MKDNSSQTCYYCGGPHKDDPCPKRIMDSNKFKELGEKLYPKKK